MELCLISQAEEKKKKKEASSQRGGGKGRPKRASLNYDERGRVGVPNRKAQGKGTGGASKIRGGPCLHHHTRSVRRLSGRVKKNSRAERGGRKLAYRGEGKKPTPPGPGGGGKTSAVPKKELW